jgi:hypothetical protein
VKSIPGKEHIRARGIALITPDPHIPDSASGPSPEATDPIAVAFAQFIFRVFRPKNACQVPKPSKCHKQNKIELAF